MSSKIHVLSRESWQPSHVHTAFFLSTAVWGHLGEYTRPIQQPDVTFMPRGTVGGQGGQGLWEGHQVAHTMKQFLSILGILRDSKTFLDIFRPPPPPQKYKSLLWGKGGRYCSGKERTPWAKNTWKRGDSAEKKGSKCSITKNFITMILRPNCATDRFLFPLVFSNVLHI